MDLHLIVYICCEAPSISLAYLSTCTYKSSREEGVLLIISIMSIKHKIDLVWPKLAMVVFAVCLLVYIYMQKNRNML